MRLLILLLFAVTQWPAMAAEAVGSQPQCESRDLAFDSKEVVCSLQRTAEQRRLRLTVNFAGGHDDTIAMMTLYLNDRPLVCEPGSKTRLMGEDGDVSLICLFSIATVQEDTLVVRSVVSWSHAQYTGHDLALF